MNKEGLNKCLDCERKDKQLTYTKTIIQDLLDNST